VLKNVSFFMHRTCAGAVLPGRQYSSSINSWEPYAQVYPESMQRGFNDEGNTMALSWNRTCNNGKILKPGQQSGLLNLSLEMKRN